VKIYLELYLHFLLPPLDISLEVKTKLGERNEEEWSIDECKLNTFHEYICQASANPRKGCAT
jgi:hypothetical protein